MPSLTKVNMNKITTEMAEDLLRNKESQFSRFIDSTPTFVTFYNITNLESTVEIGTRDIDTYVGPNSPIRYNKILDFPLWGFGQIEANIQFDAEEGSYNEFETNVKSVPSDVNINIGDMLVYPVLPEILFTVVDIQENPLTTTSYKEITIAVIRDGGQIPLLENQVLDVYTAIFNNIGTQDKVVIRNDDLIDAVELENIYREISLTYMAKFMNTDSTSILELKEGSIYYIDPMIHLFCIKNQILVGDDAQKSLFFFDDKHLYTSFEREKYPLSMYSDFEKRLFKAGLESDKYNYFKFLDFVNDFTPNYSTDKKILKVVGTSSESEGNNILISNLMKNNILNTPSTAIERIISLYIGDTFTTNALSNIFETSNIYEEILDDSNASYVYFLVPFVLYVIKYGLQVLVGRN